MTCAPSPTAAATRLTEPDRTSPMAKMPAANRFQLPAVAAGIRTGQHKSLGIESDARTGKPIRVRSRADEKKQMADWSPNVDV